MFSMPLFKIENNKLNQQKINPFKLEVHIQSLFANNLKEIFNLIFLKEEFVVGDYRLDIMAYDEENNSFVIIEFKRDSKNTAIPQGLSYLQTMQNNKADFVLEYNNSMNKNLSVKDIAWESTRIIFVSQEFNKRQREAANFIDVPIELWTAKRYHDVILIEEITKTGKARLANSSKIVTTQTEKILCGIKVTEEEELLQVASPQIREIYKDFKDAILDLDAEIECKVLRRYVSFRINNKPFVYFYIKKKDISIVLNMKWDSIDDSKKITRNMSKIGHYGTGDYGILVSSVNDLQYIMSLVKQCY